MQSTLLTVQLELARAAERLLVWANAEDRVSTQTSEYLAKEAVVLAACVTLLRSITPPSAQEALKAGEIREAAIDKLMAQASKTIN